MTLKELRAMRQERTVGQILVHRLHTRRRKPQLEAERRNRETAQSSLKGEG